MLAGVVVVRCRTINIIDAFFMRFLVGPMGANVLWYAVLLGVVFSFWLSVGSMAIAAQEHVFFDRFGQELVPDHKSQKLSKQERVLAGEVCSAGWFQVEFERDTTLPDAGFLSTEQGAILSTKGEERRAVVCAVLRDLSALLVRPPQAVPVRLRVRGFYSSSSGTAARASAVYWGKSGGMGVLDGAVWCTLNSGSDAFAFLDEAPSYHGFIEVNFAHVFNINYDATSFIGLDLYSVVLHEMIHALGWGAFLSPEFLGSYISRYDGLLALKTTEKTIPFVHPSPECYAVGLHPSVGKNGMTADCAHSTTAVVLVGADGAEDYVYAPEQWERGSSLSHLNEQCYGGESLVMHPTLAPAVAKRVPHAREITVLCALGYRVSGQYGTESASRRFAQYEPCGVLVAGGNDSLGVVQSGDSLRIGLSMLLGNDVGASEAGCIELVEGRGRVSHNRLWIGGDTVLVYHSDSTYYGRVVLRYMPKGSGQMGNITYAVLVVRPRAVPPCHPEPCAYVCNGGFEVNTGFGGRGIAPCDKEQLSFIQGWKAVCNVEGDTFVSWNTPDIWRRLPHLWGSDSLSSYSVDGEKVWGFPGGDILFPDYTLQDTWDSDPMNRHIGGMILYRRKADGTGEWSSTCEGMYQELPQPLLNDGSRYVLELYATAKSMRLLDPYQKGALLLYGDTIDPALSDTSRLPISKEYIFGTPIVPTEKWTKVKLGPFTVPSTVRYLHVRGYPEAFPEGVDVYGFIDDIVIRKVGVGVETQVSEYRPCLNDEVTLRFQVCKDEPNDRGTAVTLIDSLPDGLRYTGGDFSYDASGRLIAVLSAEEFDSSNCAVAILRAVVEKAGAPLTNRVLPEGVDALCRSSLGKTEVTLYSALPTVEIRRHVVAPLPVCRNQELTVELEVCNTDVFPIEDMTIVEDLHGDFEIVRGSVVVNGVRARDIGFLHKPYAVEDGKLYFPSLRVEAASPASGDGTNCLRVQYALRVATTASRSVLVGQVYTNGRSCTVRDSMVIDIEQVLPLIALPSDTLGCEEVVLDAGADGAHYYWSTGDTTRWLSVQQSGTYWVVVTGANGCSTRDTSSVLVEQKQRVLLSVIPKVAEPGQLVMLVPVLEHPEGALVRKRPFVMRVHFDRRLLASDGGVDIDEGCVEIRGNKCIVEIRGTMDIDTWQGGFRQYPLRVLTTNVPSTAVVIDIVYWTDCEGTVEGGEAFFQMGNTLAGTERYGEPQRDYFLGQNYPNPFSQETFIEFELPFRELAVELSITDAIGRKVAVLAQGEARPGRYRVRYNPVGLSTGVYYCVLHAGKQVLQCRMVLVR